MSQSLAFLIEEFSISIIDQTTKVANTHMIRVGNAFFLSIPHLQISEVINRISKYER